MPTSPTQMSNIEKHCFKGVGDESSLSCYPMSVCSVSLVSLKGGSPQGLHVPCLEEDNILASLGLQKQRTN